jgi:putative addiction module CopG family antidote
MEVSLPPQLDDFVRQQVRSGRYVDEEEVVRDALRQMRALVKAAEDPNLVGIVRDALGFAATAQREITSLLQTTDRQTDFLGGMFGRATTFANGAVEVVRKVPGARGVETIIRFPVSQLSNLSTASETNARAVRQNLEATAKLLGLLTTVLERVNGAGRAVNNAVITPIAEQRSRGA